MDFIQTRRRNRPDTYTDKKFKTYARGASQESDGEDSEIDQQEGTDDYEYALRLPSRGDTYPKKKPPKSEQKTEANPERAKTQTENMTDVEDIVKALAGQAAEMP